MNKKSAYARLAVVTVGALAIAGMSVAGSSAAVAPLSLNSANSFALVVGGGLSNTGQSTITGDVGLSPVISFTDSGVLMLKGAYHFGDTATVTAQTSIATAYGLAASENPSVVIASELAGQTLLPGIYTNVAGISVNGTVNLDAQNNPNAIFVLQTPLALTTGAASNINLVNGAQACNVFWQVGTTSSLGANSDFKGNLLGKGNFSSAAGSAVQGRVLIMQGSASLSSTQISRPDCKIVPPSFTNSLAAGGGAYLSQFGNANFNFGVKGTDLGNATLTNVGGHVSWNVGKSWKFTGVPATYLFSNGAGTLTGTGTLSYFSTQVIVKNASTQRSGDHGKGNQGKGNRGKGNQGKGNQGNVGRWLSATTGVANFTIKFTRVINADGTIGNVDAFAIGFTGTASAGAPQLPTLGALVQVKGGGEVSDG